MDLLNIVFVMLTIASVIFAFYRPSRPWVISKQVFYAFVLMLFLYVFVSRWVGLDQIPGGLNQDEAAAGYDAWALSQYGIDRNGYTFPILPISWGSGSGGFFVYYLILFFKVLPLSVVTLRFGNALLQVLTLGVFFDLLRRWFNQETALLGLFLLAISPWHFLLSRWALDANQVFSLVLFGVYFYGLGIQKNRPIFHFLAIAFFAFSLYSYGSAVLVVPPLLVGLYGFSLWKKQVSLKSLIFYTLSFVVLASPLVTFYSINLFDLTEIRTPWFSIPKFNVLRSDSVIIPFDENFFRKVWENLGQLVQYLTVGRGDFLWNQMPGYGIIFLFTFPLLLVGLIAEIKREKSYPFYAWLVTAALFSLILHQNTNRMGILFIPMIYFHVQGLRWVAERGKRLLALNLVMIATASIFFHADYLNIYQPQIAQVFSQGYGEALTFALSLNRTTYYLPSQSTVNGSHVLALFYIQPDPHDVVETGIYLNPGAEFQYLASFDSEGQTFRFMDPLAVHSIPLNTVYMVKIDLADRFNGPALQRTDFHQFSVFYSNE